MKKLLYWFAAVLMLFSISITAFATNETDDGNIKIRISTNKSSYSATGVAEITATITNISNQDINNVSAQAIFDDLSPADKGKSETNKSVDVLKSGESFSFRYKATLNGDKHKLNIFEKIVLFFARLFNGGYIVSNNNLDVITECVTEIKFGKFVAENTVQVGYEKKSDKISDDDFRAFQEIRESIDDLDTIKKVSDVLEADKQKGNIVDYKVNENYITFETASGIRGIWEAPSLFNPENKSVSLEGKSNRIENTPSGNSYESIIQQASPVVSSLGDVAVIRPYRNSSFRYDDFVTTGEIIADSIGVDVDVFDNDDADLSVLRSLDKYGIILIDSHGFLIDNEPCICLTQTFDNQEILADDLKDIYVNQNNQICVHSSFFENNYADNQFKECLVFLGTCYSMYDESFSDTLIKKGVDCVYGYSDLVSVTYCNNTLVESMLENLLLDGDTSSLAYNDTVSDYTATDPYNPGTCFLRKQSGDFCLSDVASKSTVEGTVTAEASENPVSGVKISITDNNGTQIATTTTDANGKYTLNLFYGDYLIAFDHDSYKHHEISLTVNSDNYTQDIKLKRKPSTETITASGNCGDNTTWTLLQNGELTIEGSGAIEDYNGNAPWIDYTSKITKVIIESGITRIGYQTFYGCSNLQSIVIGDDVASIGEMAFTLCTSLTDITIPDSVITIEDCAFSLCINLANITIGNSVTSIGDSAFYGCKSLTDIEIPNGITTVSEDTFMDCTDLESVTLPDSITNIEENTFSNCTELTKVYYKGTAEQWQTIDIIAHGNDCLRNANIQCNS